MADIDISDYKRIMERAIPMGECRVVPSNSANGDMSIRTKDGKVRRAHIIVWLTRTGNEYVGYGKFIVRNCGTPGCVRFEHLEEIDTTEREKRKKAKLAAMTEAEREARAALRAKVSIRGLTDKEVLNIYNDERSQRKIAYDYGCNPATVHKIKNGKIHSAITGHVINESDAVKVDRRYKVTDEQVFAIREDGRSLRQIAKDYGISATEVFRIKKLINRDNAQLGN